MMGTKAVVLVWIEVLGHTESRYLRTGTGYFLSIAAPDFPPVYNVNTTVALREIVGKQ